ncbi:MAG: type IV pilus modification protein PilV [gamma proteobacterium endosymbiont of Lamellibrachia anaximandri]|nr:type IV pilus modification protein PilV [gamma proteobacterium endosymbiont of Lamellibrachia anaximandri]MBL3533809.1 type IV pilus modification protein PilV [gamma proteobacterium endosymbiont of Lamellibrachia anaximandri]
MRSRQRETSTNRHAGFTLMEVLVTVIILSIGLLGVAGMQFNSLKSNQGAMQSSLATMLVLDGADRLRSNTAGVTNAEYNLISAAVADPGCIAAAAGCTPAQLADYDASVWFANVAALLPGGQGVICLDSTPDDGAGTLDGTGVLDPNDAACDGAATNGLNQYVVKVWWDHDRDGVAAVNTPLRRFVMSVIP